MQKQCLDCSANFEITNADLAFYQKVSPKIGGKICDIPSPKLCPDCRLQRSLTFRNERSIYKRKCDLCSKEIVSIYHQDSIFPVYCSDCWYSDKYDATDFGQEFDTNKTFFEQFKQLQAKVPRLFMFESKNINSVYANGATGNKDCYLIFVSDHNQNTNYSYSALNCTSSADLAYCKKCELCYECIGCEKSYELKYSENCSNCSSSQYLLDCRGCANCSFCFGLRQKSYHIFNKQYTKEEYFKELENLKLNTKTGLENAKAKYQEILKSYPRVFFIGVNNENATGDFLFNSKNTFDCFDSYNLEDSKRIINGNVASNCYDSYVVVDSSELVLDSVSIVSLFSGGFNYCVWHGSDIWNCDTCTSSSHLFGCVGLQHKNYCILNKQYTKEEYEALVPKIIEHMIRNNEWGEFFPITLSPFAYNETVAQEYFPLNKEEVIKRGWKWKEQEDKIPSVTKIIPAEKLPDDIKDIPDDILAWAIKCEQTKRPFKIQKAELEFYRKMNLPIPHLHPDVRHENRMKKRNPRKLWDRKCSNCNIDIQTTYAPEREEKVLCEKCYLQEVN